MKREHYQAALASTWVLTIGVAAVAAGVSSVAAFSVVALVALAPPLIMQVLWRDPPSTLSETIRDARR